MAGPKAATTTSKGRTYGLDLPEPHGHKTLWSVTTIIGGGLPKPALVPWAMKTTAEYAVSNYRRLYAMCEAAEGDEEARYQVVAWLKGAPYRERERKADLGTLLHALAEAKALGRPLPTISEDVAPLYAQYQRFMREWRPRFEMAEATVYNVAESYAGTLDAIMWLDGRLVLADYKSGADIYPEVALQLAAYERAEGVYLGPRQTAPMPAVEGAVVIHITADGYRVVPIETGEPVWNAFRYAREVFRFQEEISKRVLGEPMTPPARTRRTRKAAAA